nr:Phage T7 exclusion protein [Klebsiella oxytoca]
MIDRYLALNSWFSLYELDTNSVADRLLQRMYETEPEHALETLRKLLLCGRAWRWIAEYCRHLLWQHGLRGNLAPGELEQWLPPDRLKGLCEELAHRLNSPVTTSQLPSMSSLTGYIWAWCDISGVEVIREWMKTRSRRDEDFLQLLLLLRYKGTNSATGRYQALKLSQFSEFLGEEQTLRQRLESIEKEGKYPELINEVNNSLKKNRF